MSMVATPLLLVVALFQLAVAQTFEVAAIHASQFQSADGEGNGRESVEMSSNRLTMRNVTLRSCLSWAYNVQDFQITGNLGTDRYDITAKAAAPSTIPMLRAMLGTLLIDRFKLTFHRDTKPLGSFTLVVAKGGPKLRMSRDDAPGVLRPSNGAMVAQHATMSEFVSTLAGPLRTPVLDKTGLTGRYDFTVDLSSYFADTKAGEQPDITSMMTSALREQLGLSLESRKEPVEILVVDHVERPTEN
jgi:uncharacterized protein (TIGR03435 family)